MCFLLGLVIGFIVGFVVGAVSCGVTVIWVMTKDGPFGSHIQW